MVDALKRVVLWRWAVLYVLVAAWVLGTVANMGDHVDPRSKVAWIPGLDLLLTRPAWLATGAVYLAAALAFTFRRRERLAGAFLFLWIGVMGLAEIGVRNAYMQPLINMLAGNMVLAWLIGSSLPGDAAERARRGHAWMCGFFAAMLTLSGISKLLRSGADWFDAGMHSLLVWERAQPMIAPEPLAVLRHWVAAHPALCLSGAVYTLVVECLALLFVVPRLRKPHAVAVAVLFTSMDLVLGLGEQGWAAIPLALAWTGLDDQPGSSRRQPQP